MPYAVFSFREEYGITMGEIGEKLKKNKEPGTPCSFCGVLKRALINRKAKEMKADKVATGHNLNDRVQSIVMNVFDNDLKRMAGLGPVSETGDFEEFVPGIMVLYETPENEIVKYMKFKGIKYDDRHCPLRWEARRNHYRKIVDKTEERYPGSKYSVLRTLEQVGPFSGRMPQGRGNCENAGCAKALLPGSGAWHARSLRCCQEVYDIIMMISAYIC